MKLKQLHYFLEVVKCMNISQAADKLFISQPSLTVAIKNLEKELGITLFNRSKQRLHLTNEGKVFSVRLKPILDNLELLKKEMISIGNNSNELRIGMPPMMGSLMFPRILSKFIHTHPEMNFIIKEHGALKVQQLLLDEFLDLTLILVEGNKSTNINILPIEKRTLKLYVKKSHHLSTYNSVSIKDLCNESLIIFNHEYYVNQLVKEFFQTNQIKLSIIMETSQISTIEQFISEDIALSILIEGSINNNEFVAIPIDGMPSVTIALGWKKNRFISNSTKTLINFVKNKEYD